MSDRLEEIKRLSTFPLEVDPGLMTLTTVFITTDDINWLISEVERLTQRCKAARELRQDSMTPETREFCWAMWLQGKP